MQSLTFQPNGSTPGVCFDIMTGKFEISGTSFPEDAYDFFNPIFLWLDDYLKNPLESTVLDFRLAYFNTISAKNFLHIMTQIEEIASSGKEAKIRWFYGSGDEDMYEAGEEFESIVEVDFELIQSDSSDGTDSDDYFDDLMDELM